VPNRHLVVARAAAAVALLVGATLLASCGDDGSSDASSSATTAPADAGSGSAIGGNVLPPVVLGPERTSATVAVGTVVTFDMGEPDGGTFVATSEDASVFRVDAEGKDQGSYTTNAGGTAMAKGSTRVSVVFEGSSNGVGSPTIFTVTVT
jgi:hypothetical protein